MPVVIIENLVAHFSFSQSWVLAPLQASTQSLVINRFLSSSDELVRAGLSYHFLPYSLLSGNWSSSLWLCKLHNQNQLWKPEAKAVRRLPGWLQKIYFRGWREEGRREGEQLIIFASRFLALSLSKKCEPRSDNSKRWTNKLSALSPHWLSPIKRIPLSNPLVQSSGNSICVNLQG